MKLNASIELISCYKSINLPHITKLYVIKKLMNLRKFRGKMCETVIWSPTNSLDFK